MSEVRKLSLSRSSISSISSTSSNSSTASSFSPSSSLPASRSSSRANDIGPTGAFEEHLTSKEPTSRAAVNSSRISRKVVRRSAHQNLRQHQEELRSSLATETTSEKHIKPNDTKEDESGKFNSVSCEQHFRNQQVGSFVAASSSLSSSSKQVASKHHTTVRHTSSSSSSHKTTHRRLISTTTSSTKTTAAAAKTLSSSALSESAKTEANSSAKISEESHSVNQEENMNSSSNSAAFGFESKSRELAVSSTNSASSAVGSDYRQQLQRSSVFSSAGESFFTSPDVRSLVKEIGTDFAELESALSANRTTQLQSSGSQSNESAVSVRLFGIQTGSNNSHFTRNSRALSSNSGSQRNLTDYRLTAVDESDKTFENQKRQMTASGAGYNSIHDNFQWRTSTSRNLFDEPLFSLSRETTRKTTTTNSRSSSSTSNAYIQSRPPSSLFQSITLKNNRQSDIGERDEFSCKPIVDEPPSSSTDDDNTNNSANLGFKSPSSLSSIVRLIKVRNEKESTKLENSGFKKKDDDNEEDERNGEINKLFPFEVGDQSKLGRENISGVIVKETSNSYNNDDNKLINDDSNGQEDEEDGTTPTNSFDQRRESSSGSSCGTTTNLVGDLITKTRTRGMETRAGTQSSSSSSSQLNNTKRRSSQQSTATVMSKSITRIERKMADLCSKLESCATTKEAIDLLNIMVNMIEKAWSVHSCGYDLGFKLCSSFREAGGLDILMSFICEFDAIDSFLLESGSISDSSGNNGVDKQRHWTDLLLSGPNSNNNTGVDQLSTLTTAVPSSCTTSKLDSSTVLKNDTTNMKNTNEMDENTELPSTKPNQQLSSIQLRLDLSRANQNILPGDCGDKSDLQISSNDVDEGVEMESRTRESIKIEDEEQQSETNNDVVENKKENIPESDAKSKAVKLRLEQEELILLSARMLSQVLTFENREHLVQSGMQSVIKLACSFTTMKSTRSHQLVSQCSKLLLVRQSSSAVSSNALATTPTANAAQESNQQRHMQHQQVHDCGDLHAIIGTEILQHLFKYSEDACSEIVALGGLRAVLYGCRSTNIETLRRCASALANLALYGGPDCQATMVVEKAHLWLFPLAFNKDANVQYYACLAIAALSANKQIEAEVLRSTTLDLVEPFVTTHEPQRFATSSTAHIHGQSAGWLRRLMPLLASKRREPRTLAAFHFAMEAFIKRAQGKTQVFAQIGLVEPLKQVAGSPLALASRFACQALRLIGAELPHRLSQQVPLWTIKDVLEWLTQVNFEKFKPQFEESAVDGDLLLQLNDEMLAQDIGISNGILRRRFLRELSSLKRLADYSPIDSTNLVAHLGPEFAQHAYSLLLAGVTKHNIHSLSVDTLIEECQVSNAIQRLKLASLIQNSHQQYQQSLRPLTIQQQHQYLQALKTPVGINNTNNQLVQTMPEKSLDVFISYRRATGSQLASLLKVHLQLRGFSVFIDVERLEAGKFDNKLIDSIKAATHFVLVLSPGALDRCLGDNECVDWVHKEIVAALAANCNIIPVLDNFCWPDAAAIPADMRSVRKWNGVLWIHDYQDACVDKIERFMRGEPVSGAFIQPPASAQPMLTQGPQATSNPLNSNSALSAPVSSNTSTAISISQPFRHNPHLTPLVSSSEQPLGNTTSYHPLASYMKQQLSERQANLQKHD